MQKKRSDTILVNDKRLADSVHCILTDLLGKEKAIRTPKGATGGRSEDFAYVSQKVPLLMLALAAGEPEKGYPYSQHHPKGMLDKSVLGIGASVYAATAINWLNSMNL